MALNAFQPQGSDRLLASFMPFVCPARPRPGAAGLHLWPAAKAKARSTKWSFNLGNRSTMQGDLHIACIQVPQQEGPPTAQFMCAIIDQEPLLAERPPCSNAMPSCSPARGGWRSVINASMDAIISVDKAMRITVFNPTAAALFACSAGCPGQPLGAVFARGGRLFALVPHHHPGPAGRNAGPHSQWPAGGGGGQRRF